MEYIRGVFQTLHCTCFECNLRRLRWGYRLSVVMGIAGYGILTADTFGFIDKHKYDKLFSQVIWGYLTIVAGVVGYTLVRERMPDCYLWPTIPPQNIVPPPPPPSSTPSSGGS